MHKIAVLTGGTLFALAVAFAQTPPASQTLTDNPVFQKGLRRLPWQESSRTLHGWAISRFRQGGGRVGIIANGKGRMPKYATKLSTEEIDTLVQEVKVLNKK